MKTLHAFLVSLALIGCGADEQPPAEQVPTPTTEETAPTSEPKIAPSPEAARCGSCFASSRCSSRRVRNCCLAGPGTCYPGCC